MSGKAHQVMSDSSFGLENRKLLITVSVVVVTFLIDSNVGYVADFIPEMISSPEGIALFIVIGAVFGAGGYVMLRHVRQITKSSKIRGVYSKKLHLVVSVSHYVLIGIFALVIIQIFTSAQYSLLALHTTIAISYGLWIITLGLLTRAFVNWHRSSTKNALILVLTLSLIAYLANGISGLAINFSVLQLQPEVVASDYVAVFPDFRANAMLEQFYWVNQISSSIAYVLTWIGTVMLLRPYIDRIGKIKLYSILGVTMVYYLIQFPFFVLGYYTPTEETAVDVMNNILIFGIASVLSGIIFGASFLAVARTLPKAIPLRQYMIISASGFLLFYVAGSSVVSQAAYPPYGFSSVGFIGLSCYLIYSGLYSSAATVSQDIALRLSIRKTLAGYPNLLDSLGTAHMERELQEAVLQVVKKKSETLEEESGIQPSMTEDDIKDYLEIVMKEIKSQI